MALPNLKIPEYYRPGIKHLIELSGEQIGQLISALRTEDPIYYLPRELAAHVASKVEIPASAVSAIINSITGLYTARAETGLSIDQFAEVFFAAVEQQELKPSDPDKWQRFGNTVRDLLALNGALAVASKALNVVIEQDRIFLDARVLTDLRSVFKEDPKAPPSAMAIIHTLRINFRQSQELQSFFVAMDDRDIAKLKDVLNRAEEKSGTLRKMAKSATIPIINIAGESEA